MSTHKELAWDKEILPRRGLLDIPWRELWRYRDLIFLLSRRDLSAQYKQTVLGPLWFVLQPLLATFVFSFIFGRFAFEGAGSSTAYTPHFLFYMSGLVTWGLFADCVNKTSNTFTKNAQLFGKVYFPRLAVPISQMLTNLAAFAVQFSVFLIGLGFYWAKKTWFPDPQHTIHLETNWRIFFLPLFLLQTAMLGLGIGLIVSAVSTRYRDLAMATGFGVQLWMYGSSVVFPISAVRDAFVQKVLALNPIVPIIEGMRFAFLGFGTVTKMQIAVSFATCLAVFLIGVVSFNSTEQNVMDTV
jgi:lipopolysaccharide transport system permease protein